MNGVRNVSIIPKFELETKKEKKSNLLKIDGIGTITIEGLFNKTHLEDAENELRFIKENDIITHYFSV